MKVLTATKITQGQRKNDYAHATEGELVGFPSFECDGEPVDGKCGCRRAWSGLESHKSTTTAIVVDRTGFTVDDLKAALRASLEAGGWTGVLKPEEVQASIDEDAGELARLADAFPLGAVVERRGGKVQTRLHLVK